ncbi:MAG TPA: HugZ family protein [bacterium]|nr:HugZ family protein [bacterium]
MENTVAKTDTGDDFSSVQSQLAGLLSSRQSLVFSTCDAQGLSELGVAPFVYDEGDFAVLLSNLAPHTQHLLHSPHIQVMLLEDEAETRQPYARVRMSVSCAAQRLARSEARSDAVFELMQARFGSIVPLLRDLDDFHVFILTPKYGRFIAGFGKAYRLEGVSVVEHLRG